MPMLFDRAQIEYSIHVHLLKRKQLNIYFMFQYLDEITVSAQLSRRLAYICTKMFLFQYLDEITMSAQLSRRLAYICTKRLAQLINESGCVSPRTQSPMLNNSNNR